MECCIPFGDHQEVSLGVAAKVSLANVESVVFAFGARIGVVPASDLGLAFGLVPLAGVVSVIVSSGSLSWAFDVLASRFIQQASNKTKNFCMKISVTNKINGDVTPY
jgi:hypothetical protein